jgi:hypothetical protein
MYALGTFPIYLPFFLPAILPPLYLAFTLSFFRCYVGKKNLERAIQSAPQYKVNSISLSHYSFHLVT